MRQEAPGGGLAAHPADGHASAGAPARPPLLAQCRLRARWSPLPGPFSPPPAPPLPPLAAGLAGRCTLRRSCCPPPAALARRAQAAEGDAAALLELYDSVAGADLDGDSSYNLTEGNLLQAIKWRWRAGWAAALLLSCCTRPGRRGALPGQK